MKRGLCLILMVLLAACGSDDPAPVKDPPILSNETMPKQLATIAVTPTETPVMLGDQSQGVSVSQPTNTASAPLPTPTMTPYVGIFLGAAAGEEGEDVPTLAPYAINPMGGAAVNSSGGIAPAGSTGGSGTCSIPVMAAFSTAYTSVQAQIGCPTTGGTTTNLVTQPFERGQMYWRDTRQIFALASGGQFWQTADTWQEGMPADDPAFAAPSGVIQPVRGFGLVWRSNQTIRDALGWGTLPEAPYSAMWQDFERGAMFVGANNQIYAIFPAEGRHSGPLAR